MMRKVHLAALPLLAAVIGSCSHLEDLGEPADPSIPTGDVARDAGDAGDATDVRDAGDAGDAGDADAGDADAGDGRVPDVVKDSGPDDYLEPGSYVASNVRAIGADGCKLDLVDYFNTTPIALMNTGTFLALGTVIRNDADLTFVPTGGYSFGSGTYTTMRTATLSLDTRVTFLDDNCSYRLVRTSVVVYRRPNAVSVTVTNSESEYSTLCSPTLYPTSGCTSQVAFDLTKAVDAGR